MKDLLLYVADADAEAFIRSVLNKPQALGIRAITFDIKRHPLRDSGMVQSGAELTRMEKGKYTKALLAWDYHGSGRNHKLTPKELCADIQRKLDTYTWCENSAVAIFVPEPEQWLWFCENAMCAYYGIDSLTLQRWHEERSQKMRKSVEDLKSEQPKELFEFVVRDRLKRTISPRDFGELGQRAGIGGLMACESFLSIVAKLREWFPQ